MRRNSLFWSVLVIALLGAGCSSGKSSNVSASTTVAKSTTSAASTSTTSVAPATTDPTLAPKATAALPQPADFPAAFKQQPDQSGDCPASAATCSSLALEAVWHDIITCLGVTDTPQASATSPTYLQNLATQARATVEYTTEASATAIATALAGPMFQGCATTAFTADAKRNAPPGATPGTPAVSPLTFTPVGQKISATRIMTAMNLQDLPIKLYQDFLVVFNGRTVIRMFFLNPGSGFPPTLEQSLVQKVVARAGT
ncbi:MAG: hypothetical protein M3N98_14460 [Actinomycetota bacterium]|nr:hypothetical protein [Actinomycetota bacterium]